MNKVEELGIFKNFKVKDENHSERSIKVLRAIGGREYTSKKFEKIYLKYRIEHEVTTPYTLQYNGLAERRNMTFLNIKRYMLKENIYGEVVAVVTYLRNNCPTKRLKGVLQLIKPYG